MSARSHRGAGGFRLACAPAALLLGLALALTPVGSGPAGAAADSAHVAVPASIDHSGRTDVTKALQQFLGGVRNGSTVDFADRGQYRVDGTLIVGGRKGLTLDGHGAAVFAGTRGAYDRAQWWIRDSDHIVVRNMTVRGANRDAGRADDAYVAKLEAQHGFRIEGSTNVVLDHVTVNDVYGDFVYIGRDKQRVWSGNVEVRDSTFARNGRQGIAVVAARNVVIERNHISDTRRSTIDLEPNTKSWGAIGVRIVDNQVGPGRLLFIASHGGGPVNDVVVSGNRLDGHLLSIDVKSPSGQRRSDWTVQDNSSNLRASGRTVRFIGVDRVAVRDNTQPAKRRGVPLLVLTDVCGATVSGNDFGGAQVVQHQSSCDGASKPARSIPATPRHSSPATRNAASAAPVHADDHGSGRVLLAGVAAALALGALTTAVAVWLRRRGALRTPG